MMATVIKQEWNGCHSYAMMLTVTKQELNDICYYQTVTQWHLVLLPNCNTMTFSVITKL
jgi:hypothetical protein